MKKNIFKQGDTILYHLNLEDFPFDDEWEELQKEEKYGRSFIFFIDKNNNYEHFYINDKYIYFVESKDFISTRMVLIERRNKLFKS